MVAPKLRWPVSMFVLILAGEAAFYLPFVLARVFRPTFLSVFEITNLELGIVYSVYGTVAIGAYLIGGPLADRFQARKLMGFSLAVTALGGIYMASLPGFAGMQWLFGFWGVSTILMFWAAFIRAGRELGGQAHQGKAYGLVDGGRGLVAAGMASVLVIVFAAFLPDDHTEFTKAERAIAFRQVIYFVTGFVFLVSVLVWFFFRPASGPSPTNRERKSMQAIRNLAKKPTVWLQSLIIICAYVGYKATDDFSLYAQDVMHYTEVESAGIGTLSFWVRPVVAVLAGVIADRRKASSTLGASFVVVGLGALGLGAGYMEPGREVFFIGMILTTSAGIFAARGLYFAITQQARVPLKYMGTVVGLVSIIGYTPDIFFGPLMGYLLDNNPGPVGHQHVFLVLAGFSFMGMLLSWGFHFIVRPPCSKAT